ncbi:MAG: hypothetical protein MI742_14095, partial [Desulfobacterales bacterium]|nr:hypothetical protein [Desulfobacterales bacterium]
MKRWILSLFLMATMVVGAACNNSSSSSNKLSGTAAAGAAVTGTITVAGSGGNTVGPFTLGDGGTFSVDVSTLTPPLMVEVEGTANGQNVHFFVAATETGRLNVTPMTHAATRMAMGEDVTSVTQTIPAGIDVEAVTLKIAQAVQPILEQLGISTSVDLLHGVFEANGVGIDELMDLVGFEVDASGNIIINNRGAQGSPAEMGRIPINDGEIIKPTEAELEAFVTSRAVFSRARALATAIETLFPEGQGYPAAAATQQALGSFVSTTFLEYGRAFDTTKTLWESANATGPKPGVEVLSIGLLRPMDLDALHNSFPVDLRGQEIPEGYDRGIWVTMLMRNGSTVQEYIFGFVRQSSNSGNVAANWKWNGNGVPFEFGGDIRPETVKRIAGSAGEATYSSGFTIHLENYQAGTIGSKNIAAVYVFNDLFPEHTIDDVTVNCIKLAPKSGDPTAPWEIITSDSDANTPSADVNDGNRYVKAFSETEAQRFSPEAFFVAVNSSDTEILGWPGFVTHLPVPVAVVQEASAQHFASINVLGTTAVANALAGTLLGGNPAELAVDWTNPSDTKLRAVEAAAFFTGQTGPRFSLAPNPNPLSTAGEWHSAGLDLSDVTTTSSTGLAIR